MKAASHALSEPGKAYAIYVNGGTQAELVLELPTGEYKAEWVDTKTGAVAKAQTFEHAGGVRSMASPLFTADIALRVNRVK